VAAPGLFLERGFDEVTIAEVAAAAGVSKVTVFAHFERKEDLFLDRLPDAVDLARAVIRERAPGADVVLMGAPALLARLRDFEHEIETTLSAELAADPRFSGDPALTAALLTAAYRTVAVESIRRRLAGDDLAATMAHQQRLNAAFDAVAHGLTAAAAVPGR
jgi:AcrR family transcriptional regulator